MTTRPDVRVDALTGELCRRKLRRKARDGTWEDTSARVGAFCWALQDATGATVLARSATFAVEDDIPTLSFAFDGADNLALLTGKGESEDYRHNIVELVTGGQRIHLGGVYAVRRGLDVDDLPGTATDGGGPATVWELSGDPELLVISEQGGRGLTGASAYEVAVAGGFVGDEAAWLATLGGIVPWAAPAAWVTVTDYHTAAPTSVVTIGGSSYVCEVAHTSGVFATDLAAGKWLLIAGKGDAGAAGADGAAGETGWSAVDALASGVTLTPTLATALDFSMTLTSNVTIANPTGATSGMTFVVELVQGGAGGWLPTFGSAYKFPGGIAPILSVAVGARDLLFGLVRADGTVFANLERNYG